MNPIRPYQDEPVSTVGIIGKFSKGSSFIKSSKGGMPGLFAILLTPWRGKPLRGGIVDKLGGHNRCFPNHMDTAEHIPFRGENRWESMWEAIGEST
jgi:hypothetical protein